jgi:coatomer protein complex subunit epsilon
MGELFELRNYFLLGNYQAAINAGNSVKVDKLSQADQIERNVYLYRSYIGQNNFKLVEQEIKETVSQPVLKSLRMLATYMAGKDKENIVSTFKQWLSDGTVASSPHLQVIAATIFYLEESFEEALRCVHGSNSIEGLSFLIQIYLKINRLDLAEKELKSLQHLDDDATGTLLASGWVYIALGGEKLSEAFSIFHDLIEKYGATSKLLNGKAICSLHANNFPEAEKFLLQALEKNSTDVDTIVNLITCYKHQDKSQDVIDRYINQLKVISPNHAWLKSYQQMETNFDTLAAKFKPANIA